MRVSLVRATILHQRDFQDHHAIIDFLTRDHGRISLMARGLRGKKSRRAGLLQPFTELLISYSGRGDLQLLGSVEDAGKPAIRLSGMPLICALYMNELLIRLLPVGDPHPEVYDVYVATLNRFEQMPVSDCLRQFEVSLLDVLGYGLILDHDVNMQAIEPAQRYRYDPEAGARRSSATADDRQVIHGTTLMALSSGRFESERDRIESRRLMTAVIDHLLEGRVLNTRQLLKSYHVNN